MSEDIFLDYEDGERDYFIVCCLLKGCFLKSFVDLLIFVWVICNNDVCYQSGYMYVECFDDFEEEIFVYLCGIG